MILQIIKKKNLINKDNPFNDNEEQSNIMLIKFQEFLSTYIKNKVSIFPKLNWMAEGDIKLGDIYNFLLLGKQNNFKKMVLIYRKYYF